MAATLTDPLLGHLIDGRYEVLSRIARGGMATVYLAVDRRLDREVAIKVMHPHLAEGGAGSEFIARFRREARAAARLTHPGLVGVFDQGLDGETSYLTMEYIEGTNLRRHLGERGSLTVGEAFATAEAVLDALSAAHRVGLVHRDVKPENVLLASDGRIKVADFGLARAVTEVTATTTGTVLGTVAYLAPELVAHGTSDTRTDVYALGILLYEMLTGKQPFTGATPIQIAYQHVNSDVPAPSDALGWLPLEVDELVGALAARDPADRPADARAALELLRRTRAALDDKTLARRAEVAPSITLPRATADGDEILPEAWPHAEDDDADAAPDDTTTDDGPSQTDPDATAALDVGDRRSPRSHDDHDDEADGSLRRTMALRIGSGLEPRPEPEAEPEAVAVLAPEERVRRRRLFVVLLVIGLAALFGSVALWYTSEGPGAYTTVPQDVVGVELAAAQEALDALGLTAAPTEVFDPVVAQGLVVSAEPGEGERVRKEGTVALSVSKGPDLRTVPPDLVGAPAADVTAALTAAGFVVPEPERAHHDTVPTDHVIGMSAEAGAQLPVDTEVRLTVSDGPEPLSVPSVIGTARDAAVRDLENVGLKIVEEKADFSEQYPAGVVMAQSPEPGTPGHRMDGVSITISQGPPLVDVPNVFGLSEDQAKQAITGAGFVVDVKYGIFARLPGARVVSQNPGEGQAPKGSTVTITIG